MGQSLCKLTLVYPASVEGQIVEALLHSEPPLPGFTTFTADGHGVDFASANSNERVRGRVRRGVMMVVLPRTRLAGVLAQVASAAPVPHLMHWVEPVESCGRLVASVSEVDDAGHVQSTATPRDAQRIACKQN